MKYIFSSILMFATPLVAQDFPENSVHTVTEKSVLIGSDLMIRERLYTSEDGDGTIEFSGYRSKNSEFDQKVWTIKDECNNLVPIKSFGSRPEILQTLCNYKANYKNVYGVDRGIKLFSYSIPHAPEPFQIRVHSPYNNRLMFSRYMGFLNSKDYGNYDKLIYPIQYRIANLPQKIFGVLYYADTKGYLDEFYLTYIPKDKEQPRIVVTSMEIKTPKSPTFNLNKDNTTFRTLISENFNGQPKEFNGYYVKLNLAIKGRKGTQVNAGYVLVPILNDRFDISKILNKTTLKGKIRTLRRAVSSFRGYRF